MSQSTTTTKTPSKAKARVSIALDMDKKQAIQDIAKQQNRTPHYVMLEMLTKGIEEAKAEAKYQNDIEQRVMAIYDRVEQQGSRGETSETVFSRLRTEMKAYAQMQGK